MKSQKKNWSTEKRLAIAALLLNVMELPGLGSVIAGLSKGWKEIAVFIAGLILMFFGETIAIVGIALMIVAWISGLMTGIQLVKKSK